MKPKQIFILVSCPLLIAVAHCSPPSGHQAGIFLDYGFSVNPMPDAEIRKVLGWLDARKFGEQFLNVGTFNSDGTLTPSNYTQLSHWVSVSRAARPNQKMIAYLSGGVDLINRPSAWPNIAEVCSMFLKRYHLDGINLDFEPYRPKAENYIGMLTTIRKAIGPKADLSLDYTADSSAFWSGPDFRKISQYLNEMMMMLYDSSSKTAADYGKFLDTAMIYASRWRAPGCGLVPIFPVYATNETHDPKIETLQACAGEVRTLMRGPHRITVRDAAVWWYYGWSGKEDDDAWRTGWVAR